MLANLRSTLFAVSLTVTMGAATSPPGPAKTEAYIDKAWSTLTRSMDDCSALADDGTIREKYNMVSGNADVKVSAGYADNVIGFGWSNGVYLKLRQLLDAPATTEGGAAGTRKGIP